MSEHSDDACEVPLVERLRSVPSDARAEVEVGYCHHRYIPYGHLCHDAATKIRYFEAELAAANAEIARLQAGGCSRDQRTTQWCAEAVDLAQKLDAANARIALLISERDTARMRADRNYKLREEFVSLLNTEDIERGVEFVNGIKRRVVELEQWIQGLETVASNPREHRQWVDQHIGWLHPNQFAYVGPQKPEGLR